MPQDTTARTDAAVSTVVYRLRLPQGESLARRLLAAEYDPDEGRGLLPSAVAAFRIVRRRLGYDVPPLCDAAETLDIDPRDVVAAERTLAASLSPPADEDEQQRLDDAIQSIRNRLQTAEDDGNPGHHGRMVCPGESAAELRAHLDRLEADRSMARLGFTLYDLAHGNSIARTGRRPQSGADHA
ncbi:hypothetical protein ELS19_12410 [Halogeometricum borinquense]|nr:hypothetical protein [Halogeometricum borinquense]RYJ14674.1 hypothetical protein ELS19_12410 [Halogeometricum borinquense]